MDRYGGTLLHRAASEGHAQAVEALRKAGADVNAKDKDERTPHDWAESQGKGRTQAAETLRKAGADVNTKDKGGRKPPDWTADKEAELDVHARDRYGRTQLHRAAYKGNVETVKALLNARADVNAKDDDGFTPLHSAREGKNKTRGSVIRILKAHGGHD